MTQIRLWNIAPFSLGRKQIERFGHRDLNNFNPCLARRWTRIARMSGGSADHLYRQPLPWLHLAGRSFRRQNYAAAA